MEVILCGNLLLLLVSCGTHLLHILWLIGDSMCCGFGGNYAWLFWPCSVICNCIHIHHASLTNLVCWSVNSATPSVIKWLGIPMSLVNSMSDLPASLHDGIAITLVNFP